jgi:hypothetical protein
MFQPLRNRFRRAVLSVSSSAAIDDLPGEHSSAAIFDERKAQSMNDRINGFQRDDLEGLKKELTANPDTRKFKLRAKNRWIDGTQSLSPVSRFLRHASRGRRAQHAVHSNHRRADGSIGQGSRPDADGRAARRARRIDNDDTCLPAAVAGIQV